MNQIKQDLGLFLPFKIKIENIIQEIAIYDKKNKTFNIKQELKNIGDNLIILGLRGNNNLYEKLETKLI